jgi:predicted enzyme related to lactoylglutathione lyase
MTNHARSGGDRNHHTKGRRTMDWKLEVVQVPVTDVERAKRFYSEQVGFAVDLETDTSSVEQTRCCGSGSSGPGPGELIRV